LGDEIPAFAGMTLRGRMVVDLDVWWFLLWQNIEMSALTPPGKTSPKEWTCSAYSNITDLYLKAGEDIGNCDFSGRY
jgi:hypothetical protein